MGGASLSRSDSSVNLHSDQRMLLIIEPESAAMATAASNHSGGVQRPAQFQLKRLKPESVRGS